MISAGIISGLVVSISLSFLMAKRVSAPVLEKIFNEDSIDSIDSCSAVHDIWDVDIIQKTY